MTYTALRNISVNGCHIAAGSIFDADAATAGPLLAMGKVRAGGLPADMIDLDEPAAGDAYDAPKAKRGKR